MPAPPWSGHPARSLSSQQTSRRRCHLWGGADAGDFLSMLLKDGGEVIQLLEIEPVIGSGAEVLAEAQGGGGGDALAALDDGGDAAVGDAQIFAESVLADAEILKGFTEGLAGMWVFQRGGVDGFLRPEAPGTSHFLNFRFDGLPALGQDRAGRW